MNKLSLYNRVWAEIDLDNLVYNLENIKKKILPQTHIMAVVKADAYGHGAVEISRVLVKNGVSMLAVAIIDEALQLRHFNFDVPILILGFTPFELSEQVVENEISQTVYTYEQAYYLSQAAQKIGKKAKIHIKVDTGMGRIGFLCCNESIQTVLNIAKLPNIELEGIFSHFSSADDPDSDHFTHEQFMKFENFVKELNKNGVYFKYKHIANSSAAIRFPQYQLDVVRLGLILYGLYPSSSLKEHLSIKPVMSVKARVINVKEVPEGFPISYNRRYITTRKSKIATIPIGYADGFTRVGSSQRHVLIKGEFAKVVGSICMDQCMVDVTDIEDVKIGDEVVIIGRQGKNEILADHLAEQIGTINYEVVCSFSKRIPRVYIKDGRVVKILNYIL
ncbi:alanine racemase [Caldicellulosiruptor acetigenus]|uniref:alanine racemase n=1 Tax=Caldicellulosiruptor acetigenus TaxID=301953 RepID=UPI00049298AC|nr:alanine racemase [Caldicellulosiruptor acetigenus]WAM37033.1 alanine racemase [Caldicellulosiruptor acetigenus]